MQLVALEDEGYQVLHLLERLVGFGAIKIGTVVVHLFPVSQGLDMFRIVGMIVRREEGAGVFEAADEHAFLLQVGVAQGAMDGVHAPLAGPVLGRLEQRPGDLQVVDDVVAGETAAALVVLGVGVLLDDGLDAAGYDPVFVGVETRAVATAVVHVVFPEDLFFVRVERRDEVGITCVKVQREIQELFLLLLGGDRSDFNHITALLRGSTRPRRWVRHGCRPWGCIPHR